MGKLRENSLFDQINSEVCISTSVHKSNSGLLIFILHFQETWISCDNDDDEEQTHPRADFSLIFC